MSWYKKANSEYLQKIEKQIKQKLRSHPFFRPILDEYNIPVEDIDQNLNIIFTDLEGKFAEGNGKEIKIDNKLVGEGMVDDNFHYIVHEFFHWVKRRHEALFYFNDEEEIQSFSLAMAWELLRGKSEAHIGEVFYPIIQGHFDDENKAKEMFLEMLKKAKEIYVRYK